MPDLLTQPAPPPATGYVTTRTVTLFAPPHELQLECGRKLGPIQVAYEAYGKPNAARDNVVLVCHALTGDAHAAGLHGADDPRPGWWDIMIGPGKAIDTDQYFVICSNILGGCKGTTGPSSINPATGRPWGLDFPVVTIEDMVKVQKRLLEHLGIERVLAVIGGSMGGMQVLEWAVRYPESVRSAIAIATTARLNSQAIAFDAIGRNAVLADPNFANGQYHDGQPPEKGLAIARMVGHITYLSEEGMHLKFGRQLRNADRYRYDFTSEFSVETYLDHQGRTFVERFDANSYLYVTKAMDYYDLATREGSLENAFRNVRARFLVVSFRSDWLFTPRQSRQIVDALLANGKDVTYCDIDSAYGHDAFLLEPERLGRLIRGHLAAVAGRALRPPPPAPPVKNPNDSAFRGALTSLSARLRGQRPAGLHRGDFAWIERVIPASASVLDLGCGDGALLNGLRARKDVTGLGIELNECALLDCVDRGLSVIHADVETELPKLRTASFDYAVLSQTLPALRRPEVVLEEMLRVARAAIVSFPNAAFWRRRWRLLATGRAAPDDSPRSWYSGPQLRVFSLKDFLEYCRRANIRVLDAIGLSPNRLRRLHALPNLRAEQAILVLSR
jgi:homoserine O-acetyltransferase